MPAPAPESWVTIGSLGAPHGIRGEVKLFPLSDVPNRFEGLRHLWWVGSKGEPKRLKVASVRPGKRFFLVTFEGYSDPESAATLTGGRVMVPAAERGKPPAGEFFIDDIIGMTVHTESGQELGRVTDIYQTGANDIYEVQGPDGEWLFPALKNVILNVDLEARCIVVRVSETIE
jgi:16S rRNA processing protein RimM